MHYRGKKDILLIEKSVHFVSFLIHKWSLIIHCNTKPNMTETWFFGRTLWKEASSFHWSS